MKMKGFILPLFLLLPPLIYVSIQGTPEGQWRSPTSTDSLSHAELARRENSKILGWVDRKSNDLSGWLERRGESGGPPDFIDFYIPDHMVRINPGAAEAKIASATKELYDEYFPPSDPSSYVGTFFESGHPFIQTKRGPYQWNSMDAAGLEDPKVFKDAVSTLVKSGIKSFRLGPNVHELELGRPQSYKSFVDKLETIWVEGGTPTICVAFFPSLKKWEVKKADGSIDYQKSYLLNPKWPEEMGKITEELMTEVWKRAEMVEKKTGRKVNAVVNPINEPETLAGFNRHFWHGAYANWSSPEKLRYYIPSVILIGEANVHIRMAAEKTSGGRRLLFMHNEAMTPDYYPSHFGGGRFAVSKFMLGDKIVSEGDFESYLNEPLASLEARLKDKDKKLNEVDWSFREYVFGSWNKTPEQQEKARADLVNRFQNLKNIHQNLISQTGKSMKTDNMLHLDYYYQTEFIPNIDLDTMSKELAANKGEKLKIVLGLDKGTEETENAFFNMLKNAATEVNGDLPPEGPKGPRVEFKFQNRKDPAFEKFLAEDLEEFLVQDDRVIAERLIGLRRDYQFSEEKIFQERQKKVGLYPLSVQLYRSDKVLDQITASDKALIDALNVKNAKQAMNLIIKSAKKTKTEISSQELSQIYQSGKGSAKVDLKVREILNRNGRAVLHDLFGITRGFLIGFEPQHYARQIRAGIRTGFYTFFMDYVKELRVYVAGVGESGTPFYIFAPMLHDQVMMEYAMALRNGVYGTQYSFGPAVDTRGWAKGPLSFHYEDDHEVNPSGVLKIDKDGKMKFRGHEESDGKWALQFLHPLFDSLRE